MARYRKVSIQIWNDARFRQFTDDEKLAFLFLLTHPQMTAVGAMRATIPGLAAELGWLPERLSKAFRKPLSMGMVRLDEASYLLWLPNFVKHNPPESPNVVKAWASAIESLPESQYQVQITQALNDVIDGMGEAFRKAFDSLPKGLAKGMPNQEQEQEQEQDINTSSASPKPRVTAEQCERIYAAYPRKVGRKAALASIDRALRALAADHDQPAQYLLDRVMVFAASPAGNQGEFTPHPSTWFNQGRWADDETEWQRTRERRDNGNANQNPARVTATHGKYAHLGGPAPAPRADHSVPAADQPVDDVRG